MTLEKVELLAQSEAETIAGRTPLQITVSYTADRTIMVLAGELDVATAPLLRQALVEVTSEHSERNLVLDIGLLTFLDSTGLSLFVTEEKQIRAQGRKFVLFAPTPMARPLFQITGLTEVLSIEPW